jgi:hypothetical protein
MELPFFQHKIVFATSPINVELSFSPLLHFSFMPEEKINLEKLLEGF